MQKNIVTLIKIKTFFLVHIKIANMVDYKNKLRSLICFAQIDSAICNINITLCCVQPASGTNSWGALCTTPDSPLRKPLYLNQLISTLAIWLIYFYILQRISPTTQQAEINKLKVQLYVCNCFSCYTFIDEETKNLKVVEN